MLDARAQPASRCFAMSHRPELLFVVHIACVVVLVACNGEARDPTKEAGAKDDAGTATVGAPAGSAPSCATDTDCRTISSYCVEAPCVCRALAKGEGDPQCANKVACFADPCMKKGAACQNGHCELVVSAR